MVKVPDLSGKTQEDARKALKEAGLEGGNTSQEDSATVAKDRVIYTNPQAGNSVARGTTVDLVLSTGNTSVPDVSGQDEATAKKSIEDAGLQFKKGDDVASAEVERGKAVSSNPAAGSSVSSGDTITVSFSSGAATPTPNPTATGDPNATVMPEVNGKDYETVQSDLENRGFKVKVEKQKPNDPQTQPGMVISSNPQQGQPISPNKEIILYVAK